MRLLISVSMEMTGIEQRDTQAYINCKATIATFAQYSYPEKNVSYGMAYSSSCTHQPGTVLAEQYE